MEAGEGSSEKGVNLIRSSPGWLPWAALLSGKGRLWRGPDS